MKRILLLIVLLASATHCTHVEETCTQNEESGYISVVELLRNQHREELSRWQLLQLAIIMTESKGNPDAVGASNDLGVYQMLDCYVREANRVSGSNYSHEDAVDIDNAIDIFNRLQSHYNPQRDTDEAIYRHNKSESYRTAVLRNLEIVERMEVCRQKLIEYGR